MGHRWLAVSLLLVILTGCISGYDSEVPTQTRDAHINETKVKDEQADSPLLVDNQEKEADGQGVSRGDSDESDGTNDISVDGVSTSENGMDESDLTIRAYVEGMSDELLVGQMFYLDLASYEQTGIPAGGLIFFKPDMDSWQGVQERIMKYQKESELPLFIGTDEEGGIVTRITGDGSIGGTRVASAWVLAHSDDPIAVFSANRTIALELKKLGFNMNFAPVADINSNPDNPIIGKRAFSDDPGETADFVVQALHSYEGTGVVPVVKHFPGHGDTKGDSHTDLVYIDMTYEALRERELVPFMAAVEAGVDVIMMGHIVLRDSKLDYPASMNPEVIQELLREEMSFQGLVISDSMIMGSITNHMTPVEAIEQGLEAGLDMFLMPEDPLTGYNRLMALIQSQPEIRKRVEDSVVRILTLKMNRDK